LFPKAFCKLCYDNEAKKIRGKVVKVWYSTRYLYIVRECPNCGWRWTEQRRRAKFNEKCPDCGAKGEIKDVDKRLGANVRVRMVCPKCKKEWATVIRTWPTM